MCVADASWAAVYCMPLGVHAHVVRCANRCDCLLYLQVLLFAPYSVLLLQVVSGQYLGIDGGVSAAYSSGELATT